MVQSVIGVPDMQIPHMNEVAPEGQPTHFTLEDLDGIMVSLESSTQLTLPIALEGDRLLGGDRLVRAYFEPGNALQKHQLALEEVNYGLIGFVLAAVAALSYLITQIIGAFSGKSSGGYSITISEPTITKLHRNESVMTDFEARYAAQSSRLKQKIEESLGRIHAEATMLPAQRKMRSIQQRFNGIDYDIIQDGPYTKAVEAFVDDSLRYDSFKVMADFSHHTEEWYRKWMKEAREIPDKTDMHEFEMKAGGELSDYDNRMWQEKIRKLSFDVSQGHGLANLDKKPPTNLSTQEMVAGVIRVQHRMKFDQYYQRYAGAEASLKKLGEDVASIRKQIEELQKSGDISTLKGAAERVVLKLYHHWISKQHQLIVTTLKGMSGVVQYANRLATLPQQIAELTNVVYEVIQESAADQSKKDPGSPNVIDMGEVEEVKKDLRETFKTT